MFYFTEYSFCQLLIIVVDIKKKQQPTNFTANQNKEGFML